MNLIVGRTRVSVDECLGGHDDRVQTEAALRRLLVDERLLDRMGFLESSQPVEGLDVGDAVRVKLVRTDASRGFIDFARIGR